MTLALLILALTTAGITAAGLYLAAIQPRICCPACGASLQSERWQRDGELDRTRCSCCEALSSWQGGVLVSMRRPLPSRGTHGLIVRGRR